MLYFIPTLQSDHIETQHQWIDQCHYFKRMMTNISLNITYLQDNYLGTYVSTNNFMTDTQMIAVLTYLCTLCFLLRASD